MSYKLIITGGRYHTSQEDVQEALTALVQGGLFVPSQLEIVTSMTRGADKLSYDLSKQENIPSKVFHADWFDMSYPCVKKKDRDGVYVNKLAGVRRNTLMCGYADAMVAFWNGRFKGTEDMIELMKSMDKPVFVIRYE